MLKNINIGKRITEVNSEISEYIERICSEILPIISEYDVECNYTSELDNNKINILLNGKLICRLHCINDVIVVLDLLDDRFRTIALDTRRDFVHFVLYGIFAKQNKIDSFISKIVKSVEDFTIDDFISKILNMYNGMGIISIDSDVVYIDSISRMNLANIYSTDDIDDTLLNELHKIGISYNSRSNITSSNFKLIYDNISNLDGISCSYVGNVLYIHDKVGILGYVFNIDSYYCLVLNGIGFGDKVTSIEPISIIDTLITILCLGTSDFVEPDLISSDHLYQVAVNVGLVYRLLLPSGMEVSCKEVEDNVYVVSVNGSAIVVLSDYSGYICYQTRTMENPQVYSINNKEVLEDLNFISFMEKVQKR